MVSVYPAGFRLAMLPPPTAPATPQQQIASAASGQWKSKLLTPLKFELV